MLSLIYVALLGVVCGVTMSVLDISNEVLARR